MTLTCIRLACALCLAGAPLFAAANENTGIANAAIDMRTFLRVSTDAALHRDTRRLSEREFIRMSREPGTVVLDARSRERYDELHIKGALNLSFPDIAVDSLAQLIPDRNTRILIYCNNNFLNADTAFPAKLPGASLNLSTYIALYHYGYRNLYELGPVIDVNRAALDLLSTR
ncbi:MAG: rhodanese-like domain-containing protein [Burkholderiales bacterium]